MPADAQITLRGMAELQRALARVDRESLRVVQDDFKEVAEPIREGAEELAKTDIRNILSPTAEVDWWRMRTGVTRTVVYVAPVQRGVKGRPDDPRRRRKFGDILMGKAMEPALAQHAYEVEAAVERSLDRIADHFNQAAV